MVSKVFEHPFDLTKVRLQSQVLDDFARFAGPIDCLTQTYTKEGVTGLYRGLPAPIIGAMVENASLFLTYSSFQSLIRTVAHLPADDQPILPLRYLCLAAAGSGAVTSFLLTPIELVKCKMQVQMLLPQNASHSIPLPGPLKVLASVIRTTGLRGLWLGHTGTFIRETGGTAAWFGTKEFVASRLLARHPEGSARTLAPWESALSGACAGASFNLALFPADTVKSTMQTGDELRGPSGLKASFLRTFREMYAAQGIRGLYAGCGITIARSIPSSAIIFVIYDELNKRFS
ncbi:mitochondrial carrier [Guyanagaster necrorhizus]|uniref:Mitochondrial carrier n=1 Tax=Guyanagaster necrorhizus TaxID=856835 RepID=A0A9P7VL07_9AGAR|nr:mitochondrial carrier [Guyanagaster necrorhizus MCA 3950]KAG7443068.1 mitochondrial carrier [Guyanagaster necrorhizus MCA 3950]